MSKITSLQSTKSKETIYIDVDDEITNIIEKVRSSKSNIVALVLPKRAATLQSLVNMKLLKRSAEQAKKNLVLITTERNILPLAGVVGLHVADTATSRPAIPSAPAVDSGVEDIDEPIETSAADFDPVAEAKTPIGALAGVPEKPSSIDEEIEVSPDDDTTSTPAVVPAPVKKDKKLAVPSFDSFKKKLALGIGAGVALIALLVWAFAFAPNATVKLSTETTTVRTNKSITLDTNAKEVNLDQAILPAVAEAQKKSYTQQVPATGQQNNGEKATGNAKFSVQKCTQPIGVAPEGLSSGSSVSSGGKTYILQESAQFSFTGFSSGGTCANYTTNNASIQALRGGAEYNVSNATFTAGSASGTGSASGGTDDIVKVVTQGDIDGAKAKIAAQEAGSIKKDLQTALVSKGLKAMDTSFLAGEPQITSSANAGDKADTLTLTATVNYTMLGVKKADIQKVIEDNVKAQIDEKKQKIIDDGIDKASYTQDQPASATGAVIAMKANSVAGPEINREQVKTMAKGKKAGQIETELKSIPGVTDVKVEYSPFWVSSVPNKESKITVTINDAK